MEVKLTRCGPKLTKKAIDNFKSKMAITLPDDYVDFLLSNNGGTAEGYWFLSKRAKRYVNKFFAITTFRSTVTVGRVMENYRELLPTQSLPIAFVDGGNLLLLRVDAKKFGQVDLYIDCERETVSKGIHRVSKNFEGFLDCLRYTDPSELDEDDYGLW